MEDTNRPGNQGLRPEFVIIDEVQRWGPEEDSEGRGPDEFWAWVAEGVNQGWIDEPVCDTHDLYRRTEEEQALWDEGEDPCIKVIRVWYPETPPASPS